MLFVDIIADDFFNVFINGVPVTGTDYTVTGRHVRIADSNQNSSVRIADLLVPGKNVIAVQAVDKTLIYPAGKIGDSAWFGRSFGRGLWYNLRVRINSGFTVPATSANVIPEVSSSQSLVVPGGESPVFDFSVSNEGPSTPSSDVTYTITFRSSPPGEAGGSVTPSLTSGCTLSGNLSSLAADTGGFISLPGCATATITGGVPSTGQLCAVLTIANANPEDVPPSPRTAHRCLPIGELPVVQVSGGDLVVRSALSAAEDTSRIIRTAYIPSSGIGGWAEYGVFGPSSVDIHSGGSLANRSSAPSADQKNSLVFANGGAGLSNPGSFKVSGSKPAINYRGIGFSAGSNGTCSAGRIDQMAVSGVVTNCSNSGILSIQASAISPGSSYAIRAPNATVHITGNITYGNGSHSNLSDLSQVVIEAANIVIAANTERVDAILYASETINTCGTTINYTSSTPYFHDLTSSSCDRPLVINGHIQAQRLFLRRTHSDNSTVLPRNRTPAELINGRSDVYLWLYGQSASTGVVSTGSVRELPPRL